MKEKIAFVIPQFGVFPNYIDYFLLSGSYSSQIADFYFFTDQNVDGFPRTGNAFFEKMSLQEFEALCVVKLNFNFEIRNSYKLCDMKPMYGLIFEERLKEYAFWGHCDFDMILGNIQTLLDANHYKNFDIFSVQRIYASGPFQVFRNTDKVNRLFMHSSSWQFVLSQRTYQGFDEAGDIIRELWKGKDLSECHPRVFSMTHLLKDKNLLEQLGIRVSMKELITESFEKGDRIYFERGKLVLHPGDKELYIYHFMNRKNRILFNDLLLNDKVSTFVFIDCGFYTGNRLEFVLGMIYSLLKRYWLRFVRKLYAKTSH